MNTDRETVERVADWIDEGGDDPCKPNCEYCQAATLLRELRRERDEARAHLRWALLALVDMGAQADGTPDHWCDFTHNPLKGGCDFHEMFWSAAELVGLLPEEKP